MTAKWQYKQAYEGVLEEVRSLKAENARLRACLGDNCADCAVGMGEYADSLCDPIKAENAKLRELVRQMYPGAKAFLQLGVQLGCNDTLSYDWWLQLRELGIEECAYEYS